MIMLKHFFGDSLMRFFDNDKLDLIFNIDSYKHKLTDKQRNFIHCSIDEFIDLYSNIYQISKDQQKWNVVELIKNIIEKRFALNKINTLLGHSEAETSGAFRGLIAFWFLGKEEIKKNQENTLRETYKKIEPTVVFFGSLDEAKELYTQLVLYLAIRFQLALELIDNHQDGLSNFAYFIANIILHRVIETPSIVLEKTSKQSKVNFLINKLFIEVDNFESLWKTNNLKTENEKVKWSITDLLYKSPIEVESTTYVYTGKESDTKFLYPVQICTEDELETIKHYSSIKL
jgi:hypothetical protein